MQGVGYSSDEMQHMHSMQGGTTKVNTSLKRCMTSECWDVLIVLVEGINNMPQNSVYIRRGVL